METPKEANNKQMASAKAKATAQEKQMLNRHQKSHVTPEKVKVKGKGT